MARERLLAQQMLGCVHCGKRSIEGLPAREAAPAALARGVHESA
jgi:hypothetical protein